MLGPWDWNKGSNSILKRISEGLLYYPSGNLGIVDVRSVAEIISTCLEEVLPIGPHLIYEYDPSFKDFIEMACSELAISPPTHRLSPWFAHLFSTLESIKSLLTNTKKIITKETAKLSSQTFIYEKRENVFNKRILKNDLKELLHMSINFNIK